MRWIRAVGDTGGNDIGSGTQAVAHFNPVRIRQIQNTDCVSEDSVSQLVHARLISEAVLQRLQPELNRVRALRREQMMRLDRQPVQPQ